MKWSFSLLFFLLVIFSRGNDSLVIVHKYSFDRRMIHLKFLPADSVEVWEIFRKSYEFAGTYHDLNGKVYLDFDKAPDSIRTDRENANLKKALSVLVRKGEFLFPENHLNCLSFFGGSYWQFDITAYYRIRFYRRKKKYSFQLRTDLHRTIEEGTYTKEGGVLRTKTEKEYPNLDWIATDGVLYKYRNYIIGRVQKRNEITFFYLNKNH